MTDPIASDDYKGIGGAELEIGLRDGEPAAPRLAVAIDVAPLDAELVADLLFMEGASAVSEIEGPAGMVTLVADLDASALVGFNNLAQVRDGRVRVLEDQAAWNSAWRAFAKSHRCGDRVLLRPNWVELDPSNLEEINAGSLIEVVLEPGDAFGSGSHATTRLCVEAIDRLAVGGDRVLDFGCGSGVLGVTALLLGAASVTAVDIDPEAITATAKTAELNDVADGVVLSDASLDEIAGPFDLIFANVLIPVIEEHGVELARHLAANGHVVVSGVLVEQRDRAEAALVGLTVVHANELDGWMLLVFRAEP